MLHKYLTICVILLCGLIYGCSNNKNIYIDKRNSFYSNFSVDGNYVYIVCELEICNNTNHEKVVKLLGDFTEDKKHCLVKNSKVEGYEGEGSYNISVRPGKQRIRVVFKDEFGGNNQKHSRNLPDIEIIEH